MATAKVLHPFLFFFHKTWTPGGRGGARASGASLPAATEGA